MKHFLAALITAFTFLIIGQATAATSVFPGQSVDSVSSTLICDKEKDEKKKEEDDEEPECD